MLRVFALFHSIVNRLVVLLPRIIDFRKVLYKIFYLVRVNVFFFYSGFFMNGMRINSGKILEYRKGETKS